MDDANSCNQRLQRLERALEAQRQYIRRVPDPDNRYRAETNLLTLLEMREAALSRHGQATTDMHP